MIRFVRPGPTPAIVALSPNGLVPYLEHRGARVWESLAICDYCAGVAPALWPEDRIARAHARSISAEMHAGFRELRQAMWMNLGTRLRRARPHAGRAGRHRPDRGAVGGNAATLRRRRALSVRRGFHRGGRHVCAGGDALPDLEAGADAGNARVLRCGARAWAGRAMVRRGRRRNPADWLVAEYETMP